MVAEPRDNRKGMTCADGAWLLLGLPSAGASLSRPWFAGLAGRCTIAVQLS